MSLRELASNPTLVATLSYEECPSCGFLSNDPGLTNPATPCPYDQCRKSGRIRLLYPDLCCTKLVGMAAYFYRRSAERTDEERDSLASEMTRQLGRQINVELAYATARVIRDRYPSLKTINQDYPAFIEFVRTSAGLASSEDVPKVLALLIRLLGTNEEHQMCVVLAACLVENLLRGVVERMLLKQGGRNQLATKGFAYGRLEREFEKCAGISIAGATKRLGREEFHNDVQSVRNQRNSFLHEDPYAIQQPEVDRAFCLALDSIGVFASLHNKYTVMGTGAR